MVYVIIVISFSYKYPWLTSFIALNSWKSKHLSWNFQLLVQDLSLQHHMNHVTKMWHLELTSDRVSPLMVKVSINWVVVLLEYFVWSFTSLPHNYVYRFIIHNKLLHVLCSRDRNWNERITREIKGDYWTTKIKRRYYCFILPYIWKFFIEVIFKYPMIFSEKKVKISSSVCIHFRNEIFEMCCIKFYTLAIW